MLELSPDGSITEQQFIKMLKLPSFAEEKGTKIAKVVFAAVTETTQVRFLFTIYLSKA
jgi:hypothetical protein